MEGSIQSLDILVQEKIALNTLSNFVDWFAPNRETKMNDIILIIGKEIQDYRKMRGENEWH